MALNLPLTAVPDESGIVSAMRNVNALTQENLKNKLMPLETAIKLQNSLTYSGKSGASNVFLKNFMALPVAERQAWLAIPGNREKFMGNLENARSGNSSGMNNGNSVAPKMMQELNGDQSSSGNPFQSLIPDWLKSRDQIKNNKQNSYNYDDQDFGKRNEASDELISDIASNGNGKYNSEGQQQFQVSDQPQLDSNNGTSLKDIGRIVPEVGTAVEPEQISFEKPLTTKDRDSLGAQMRVNDKNVTGKTKTRAEGGIALESLFHDLKPTIQKYVNDSAKYSGVYGRGEHWLDKFKANQPEEYQNFMQLRNSIIPLLSNGVIQVEGMSISPSSREEAHRMFDSFNKIDTAPETAVKSFNESVKSLFKVTNGVLKVAEPVYPGARRKLAGVPELKGDYVTFEGNEYDRNAPSGRIEVISPAGKRGHIPESQWEEANKEGYRRIG